MKTTVKGARVFFMMLVLGLLTMSPSTSSNSNAHAQTPGTRLITICHFGRTIRVDFTSLKYHLAHGDKIGSCITPTLTPIPNPVN